MRWLSPPLRVAKRGSGRGSPTHVEQELQAVLELDEQPVGDGAFIGGQSSILAKRPTPHRWADSNREGMSIHTHISRFGLQAAPAAGVTSGAPR